MSSPKEQSGANQIHEMFSKSRDFHVSTLVANGLNELLNGEIQTPFFDSNPCQTPSDFSEGYREPVYQESVISEPSPTAQPHPEPVHVGISSNWFENPVDVNGTVVLDPILHPNPASSKKSLFNDLSFIDQSLFTPGCMVCQLQFKHVYRDYVVSAALLSRHNITIGEFLIVKSHINPILVDLGVVTCIYTVDEFMNLKQFLGRSQDAEENFIGTVLRVATMEERAMLPYKHSREPPTLAIAKKIVKKYSLNMHVYGVEYQFDGKILYVYYTADNRVDYRGFVYDMVRECNNTRVKMKKTNQCRKFVPQPKAALALATGNLPK